MTQPETILEEAQRLTHGPRREAYGHPLDDYSRTAELWTALLRHKLGAAITPDEAALCMMAMKMSRQINKPQRENMTDAAGYAWVSWECVEEAVRRAMEDPAAELPRGPLEPEGFPDGYTDTTGASDAAMAGLHRHAVDPDTARAAMRLEVKAPTPEGMARRESPNVTVVADGIAAVFAGSLTLDCGCVKRCKGHDSSNPPAHGRVSIPAKGPKDPSGKPYRSETSDAEFPGPPPSYTDPKNLVTY